MSSLAMTITNKCFICSQSISIEISPQRTHNKIDLCSDKCKDAFKERLVDQKDGEKSPTFTFTASKEWQPNNNSPEIVVVPTQPQLRRYDNLTSPTVSRNLFHNFNDTKKQ